MSQSETSTSPLPAQKRRFWINRIILLKSSRVCLCSGCSSVERQASVQADLLSSTSSSLASSLRQAADESRQTLEEMTGCCAHLHSSVSGNKLIISSVIIQTVNT